MIVVTGATGTVGGHVVELLRARGETVRAVSRRPRVADDDGVEWFTADLTDPASLAGMATGAQSVLLVSTGATIADQDRHVLAEAERAGVARIVKLSALSVAHGAQDPISVWHRAGEAVLQAGPVPWCFLRPSGFMSNALSWADPVKYRGTVYAPFADGLTAVIDPRDIAEAAVACLVDAAHDRQAYELTGPQGLSVAAQVETLGAVIGRDLEYVEVSPQAARQSMVEAGMPDVLAEAVVGTLAIATSDYAGRVCADVTAVTGRLPRTFRDWVSTHQDAFRA